MNKVEIPITFISYIHSGRGYMSLSFRNTMPTREMINFLTGMEADEDGEIPLGMRLGEVSFRGVIKSVISRKSSLVLTIHVAPSGFIVSKFFNLVGKAGLTLTISRLKGTGEEKDTFKPERLNREEYLSLKNKVYESLKRFSEVTGREIADVVYEITTFKGRDGVERKGLKTLERISPGQLQYLNRRIEAMLNGKTQGQNT